MVIRVCGTGGGEGGGSRRIFKGLKCCFGTSKCSTSTPALFILVSPPPVLLSGIGVETSVHLRIEYRESKLLTCIWLAL